MPVYRVNVTRDDRWWMITVPELDGYVTPSGSINVGATTQTRRLTDVAAQARDFICTVTDRPPSEIDMAISISVGGIDVTERANSVFAAKRLAERHAAAAAEQAGDLARELASQGVAVRDIGEVLGVSFQRAQQLITA